MRWLEGAIKAVSPKTAYRRARYRAAVQHFDGAGSSYRQKGWKAPSGDANAALRGSLPLLRRRSRDFVRNNAIARRLVDTLVNNVVGDGIIPSIESDDPGVKREVQGVLDEHLDTTAIDAHGLNNLYGLQRLQFRSIVESGETLIRRRTRRRTDGLPLNLQVETLEPEYIDDRFSGTLASGNREYDGIEHDLIGRRVAYRIFEEHPEALYTGYPMSNRVLARNVIHSFQVDRVGQRRGVPWMAPVMTLIADAYDYADAQLLRQKLAAMFVGFTRDVGPDGVDINDPNGTASEFVDDLVPGMFEHLPPGRDVTFSDPPKAEGYGDHMSSVQHMIAAGAGVTYEALTMDMSQVNFSSARMGRIEMNRSTSAHQWCLIIPQICQPLEAWLRPVIDERLGRMPEYTFKWTPPRFEMVDPAREVRPMLEEIEGGLTSRSRTIRSRGFDPEEIDLERQADAEREEELGLNQNQSQEQENESDESSTDQQ